ncbi:UDP-N-acetylmuramate dehydrogenase [Salipaludibacillus sp. LMS25]|jgi:UDP-N-acetylmuramate dehydrogenase|uniref:UDP-N-acetylmuramate dehydrogenase n=1 Tax=Salipaludibacillus sp. LMS25 TaxID=2924031 RepID=UPI0020D03346|nr:UDP-N-acetylmuramate dehydrogenase [Salipaludibacillus sp. LMS25]UTR13335.1 UDP-N-acetylmuramate dehydrogenase [Salipaludibacillus sp. LMS25]
MTNMMIYNELTAICGENNVFIDEPMSHHTLTKIGGKADVFVTPQTYEQVADVVRLNANYHLPFMLLGNGSNMIVKDGGVRGLVMYMSHLSSVRVEGTQLTAQGGAGIIHAAQIALEHSLTGLEFACGIPGSVGGAMVMNAGAYGGEVKDVIDHVKAVTPTGDLVILNKEDLALDYRTSIIGKKHYIVLEAVFKLEKGDAAEIKEKMADLTYRRESKQPLEYPSVGSVFKRPPGYFAGKLIQDSGLQGKGVGGAEVSTKHAGFIVNKNNATAADYIATIDMVRETVKQTFGVELELEAKIVGEDLTETAD